MVAPGGAGPRSGVYLSPQSVLDDSDELLTSEVQALDNLENTMSSTRNFQIFAKLQ